MNFTNYFGFLALLGVPVIILLYLLKQRFKQVDVGSMALWNKILLESDGHRWRQKLRRNILMFMQIGAVILLALALARPFIAAVGEKGHMILVLDSSMSMQATDTVPSRFEQGKKDMIELVENAPAGTFFTIIDFCDMPYALTTLTQEKSRAISGISSISVKETGADEQGLQSLLQGMNETGAVYLFSDRNYDLGEDVTTAVYGSGGVNYAIQLMSETEGFVLVKLAAYGGGESCRVSLFGDGIILDSQEAYFGENETVDVVFDIKDASYGYLTGKIMDRDILENDNVYYLAGGESSIRKTLLITDGNIFVEKAVSLIEGVEVYKGNRDNLGELKGYDLYIFDGILPDAMPKDGHLWILNPPEENPYVQLTEKQDIESISFSGTFFSDNIDQLNFAVDQLSTAVVPVWAQTVIQSDKGSLALYGELEGQKICVFTFDIHDTQLPLLKEFPILVYNIVTDFIPGNTAGEHQFYAGQTADISLLPRTESVEITTPEGRKIKSQETGSLGETFYSTGIYSLLQTFDDGSEELGYFAVNPVTTGESNLPRGISEEGSAAKGGIRTGKGLTPYILFLLLLVLSAEWWVNWREH